jgi:hypothetical protein
MNLELMGLEDVDLGPQIQSICQLWVKEFSSWIPSPWININICCPSKSSPLTFFSHHQRDKNKGIPVGLLSFYIKSKPATSLSLSLKKLGFSRYELLNIIDFIRK